MTEINELEALRKRIDDVDAELLIVLAKRQALVGKVLELKLREGLPARIPSRIEAVITGVASKAIAVGVDPNLARALWSTMVEWFVQHEEKALASKQRQVAE